MDSNTSDSPKTPKKYDSLPRSMKVKRSFMGSFKRNKNTYKNKNVTEYVSDSNKGEDSDIFSDDDYALKNSRKQSRSQDDIKTKVSVEEVATEDKKELVKVKPFKGKSASVGKLRIPRMFKSKKKGNKKEVESEQVDNNDSEVADLSDDQSESKLATARYEKGRVRRLSQHFSKIASVTSLSDVSPGLLHRRHDKSNQDVSEIEIASVPSSAGSRSSSGSRSDADSFKSSNSSSSPAKSKSGTYSFWHQHDPEANFSTQAEAAADLDDIDEPRVTAVTYKKTDSEDMSELSIPSAERKSSVTSIDRRSSMNSFKKEIPVPSVQRRSSIHSIKKEPSIESLRRDPSIESFKNQTPIPYVRRKSSISPVERSSSKQSLRKGPSTESLNKEVIIPYIERRSSIHSLKKGPSTESLNTESRTPYGRRSPSTNSLKKGPSTESLNRELRTPYGRRSPSIHSLKKGPSTESLNKEMITPYTERRSSIHSLKKGPSTESLNRESRTPYGGRSPSIHSLKKGPSTESLNKESRTPYVGRSPSIHSLKKGTSTESLKKSPSTYSVKVKPFIHTVDKHQSTDDEEKLFSYNVFYKPRSSITSIHSKDGMDSIISKSSAMAGASRLSSPDPRAFDLYSEAGHAGGPDRHEHLYKILVIGELGTGKTSIIKRYVHQFFSQHYRATIGVDFALKVINWDSHTVIRLQLWDIAGQERFGNMTRVYYKEAVGAFVVFDVTRAQTFDCISKWKNDLDTKVTLPNGASIPTVLIANKCDQPKEGLITNPAKMDEYCRDAGYAGWFETSAKENVNIDEAAKFLVSQIMANEKNGSMTTDNNDIEKFSLSSSPRKQSESSEVGSSCKC